MGPITLSPEIWPPIEPADQPARGDLAMAGDKDRTPGRVQRRRHRDQPHPDADEFTPASEEKELEE